MCTASEEAGKITEVGFYTRSNERMSGHFEILKCDIPISKVPGRNEVEKIFHKELEKLN